MFLCRTHFALVLKLSKGTANAETRVARLDHVVDITILGSLVGIREEVVLLLLFLSEECLGIGLLFRFLGTEDGHCTTGTHHGDFG